MLYPTSAQWTKWNIESERHRFFYLRWRELFDMSTFDTWQVRSSNIRSMLDELEESARVLAVTKSHHPNIQALLSEMEVVATHDRVIRDHLPAIRTHIAQLRKLYENEIMSGAVPHVETFLRIVRITRSYLKNYTDVLFDEIESVLQESDSDKYKKDLHILAMLLGIELKNLGFSIEELRRSSRDLEDASITGFVDRFRNLRRRFSVPTVEHKCSVLVRGPGRFDGINDPRISVVTRSGTEGVDEIKFWQQDAESSVSALACRVDARDFFSARRQAIQVVESILAYWKVYRPSKEHTVHPGVLVSSERQASRFVGTERGPEVLLPRDARGPDQRAAELTGSLASIQAEHARHVSAALQYFRLSLSARKQEARLINLWIALEALFQDIGHGSLISKATKYVSDVMALNYVQDIARAIPVDIRRIWRTAQPVPFLNLLPLSSQEILHSDDFMSLMTIPDETDTWIRFAGLFSHNPLIIFRLWKLREGLFKSPPEMAKRIDQHRTNVSWQVQRIYRLRNRIAHQGTATGDISQLIGHLQTYFVTTFHDVVHCLRQRQLESLGDILESRSLDYAYLLARLKNSETRPIPVRLVATGFAELDQPGTTCLWQRDIDVPPGTPPASKTLSTHEA